MRMPFALAAAVMIAAPIHAQSAPQQFLVGPSFVAGQVDKSKFDVAFTVPVAIAGVPVMRNQSAEARYDAVVCNSGKTKGGARVELKNDWFSVLDPGLCTMFANFSQLELTPMEPGGEWKADIYLRAHR